MISMTTSQKVTNEEGYVAIRHYQTIPHSIKVNGRGYLFSVHANICIAWVHPDDVDRVLSITKVCCGGNKRTIYHLADETHVNRWKGLTSR